MSREKTPEEQARDQNFVAAMKMKHPTLDVDKAVSLIDAELEEVKVNMPGIMNISDIKTSSCFPENTYMFFRKVVRVFHKSRTCFSRKSYKENKNT